jgi:hypothetical protein
MPQYTPPNNQVVNFSMQPYTPPIDGVVNFVMEDGTPLEPQKINTIRFSAQGKPMIISNVGKPIIFI